MERYSVRKPTLVTESEVGGPPIELVLREFIIKNLMIERFVHVSQIVALHVCVYFTQSYKVTYVI